ncbi:MAG: helix-turn-helix domain-containing protein, partial [Alicyclobacillus sp.]|nr:helix-turn-helix domain-containing protein [Alicyclobacillus sp.]
MAEQWSRSTMQQRSLPPFDWLPREELRRLCWEEGLTDAEIARMFGVSTNTVYHKRKRMNLLQGALTADQLADMVRVAEQVKTLPWDTFLQVKEIVERSHSHSSFPAAASRQEIQGNGLA